MKTAFAIVTLLALLDARAVAPQQQDLPAGGEQADVLPGGQLSSDLFYKLMKAELEFQAGQWQGPYMTLMAAAQQTRDPRLARRAAEMALSARQQEQSMAAIRLWRELAPHSDEAAQYYLGLAIMSDDLTEAQQVFAKRLHDTPAATRGLAMYQIQQLLGRARDKEAAARLMERLVEPYQGSFEAHVVLAQSAASLGDTARAVGHAKAALALRPDSELAVLSLAQVSKDDSEVARLLENFIKANPKAREVRTAYARVLVNRKDYRLAREQFEAMLASRPDDLSALYALGMLDIQLGESAAAEGHLKRFMEAFAANKEEERDASRVLMMLSQLAEERGDLKTARDWVDRIESVNQQTVLMAQLRRAQLTGRLGDVAGARAQLAQARPADATGQAQVALTEGQLLRDAGQTDEAYRLLEKAAGRFPDNAEVLYDFALAAEKAGHPDLMETTLRAVIARSPDNHQAYNALGYSLAERNVRLGEARDLIEKALRMAPADPFVMDSMGWVEYRLGNLKQAEEVLRRAYTLRKDADIAVHLGEVLWKAGKHEDAQQLLREARARDPRSITLRDTLVRLNLKL